MIHELKIMRGFLQHILDGTKCFEVRYNDRDFQVGDRIEFSIILDSKKETVVFGGSTDIISKEFEGKKIPTFEIIYVHTGIGMKENYVVLGIKKIN